MSYATPTETHKAAKQHVCDWCGESIVAGETYKRWRWYDCGDAATIRAHPECDQVATAEAVKYGDDTVFFDRCGERPSNSTPQA